VTRGIEQISELLQEEKERRKRRKEKKASRDVVMRRRRGGGRDAFFCSDRGERGGGGRPSHPHAITIGGPRLRGKKRGGKRRSSAPLLVSFALLSEVWERGEEKNPPLSCKVIWQFLALCWGGKKGGEKNKT